ncbi:hypothetical protein B0H11DRAFT_2153199 [Mycena galericulata]|nr:hypothetical protein B0H11DRAFT_2153199 [Mycena galericulata]
MASQANLSSSSSAASASSNDESHNLVNKPTDSASGVQPLPKGAMATTVPSLVYHPPSSANQYSTRPPTPPATPSQRLLDPESSHVQFASYPHTPEEKTAPLMEEEEEVPRGWVPPPLRAWYAISLIVLLVCLAIALELALHFTNKNNGWKTHGNTTNVTGFMHYVYIVALWTWTDIEIKKMQTLGCHRRICDGAHHVVLPAVGFCPPHLFLTASGYASASVSYNLQQPPFIWDTYTVAPFEIPTNLATNGTVLANTTAVRSDTNCVSAPVTLPDGTIGWNNSLSQNGCTLQWSVDHSTDNLFGTSTPDCGNTTPPQFQPVVFWFFTYTPTATASATFCNPAISLWDAEVTLDLASGNVTNVHQLRPFNASTSPFGSLSGNVTGAPLEGRAYNGINFTLVAPNNDKFVVARMNATQLTMPAAVFQAAVQSSAGLEGSFSADLFVNWSNQVYSTYLTLIAKAVYFLPNQEPITMQVRTFQLRLWFTSTAVHLLAALFLILAVVATVIHIFHRHERQDLNLLHQPGTIASAVSIGAETGMGQLLAQQRNTEEIHQALRDRKFRIDPSSMRIIMNDEEGYEQGKRTSRRFSRAPGSPGLPKSPRTPQSASGVV